MTAIIGESLLYEASRVLRDDHRLSYYQYRALCSFVEMLVLHDKSVIISGIEKDAAFLEVINWLISETSARSNHSFELVEFTNRGKYVDNKAVQRFESLCKQIYLAPLGIITDRLLEKRAKDRTSEDMSETIEQLFCENYPTKENRRYVEELLRIWSTNANSSELLYFFRAHLMKAIAETNDGTCLLENQRLVAEILHQTYETENKTGTLAFTIYSLVNGLFMEVCEGLPHDKNQYPRRPLLISDVVTKAADRKGVLQAILDLREEFAPFREYYKKTEAKLRDDHTSIFERAEIKARLNDMVNKVWIPEISSLGRRYNASKIGKFFKDILARYGIGDLTIEHSEQITSSSEKESTDSFSYALPSVGGLTTAVTQTAYSEYQESKFRKPNSPLLDCLNRVVRSTESLSRLETELPVADFSYKVNHLLDRAVLDRGAEV
jgi:hypothetical protein